MFIVITQDREETVNLSNFSLWHVHFNQSETYSVFALSRAKDIYAEDEKEVLGDVALLGAYPTKSEAEKVYDALNQAVISGQTHFVMPEKETQ